jgi:hypothetical protein
MAVMYYTLLAVNNLIMLLAETLIAALAWFSSTIVTKRQVADITPSHMLLALGVPAGYNFGANTPFTCQRLVTHATADSLLRHSSSRRRRNNRANSFTDIAEGMSTVLNVRAIFTTTFSAF